MSMHSHFLRKRLLQRIENLKLFWFFFFLSLIQVIVALLLGGLTALAPDENYYSSVLSNLHQFKTLQSFPGFNLAPALALHVLYLPGHIFLFIGIEPIIAVRFVAIFYSILTYIIIYKLVRANRPFEFKMSRLLIIIFSIPSFLIWRTLGLRESFLFFFISLLLFSFQKLITNQTAFHGLLHFIALYGLYITKTYIFLLYGIALLVFLLLMLITKRLKPFLVPSLIALLVLVFNYSTVSELLQGVTHSALLTQNSLEFEVVEESGSENSTGSEISMTSLVICKEISSLDSPLLSFARQIGLTRNFDSACKELNGENSFITPKSNNWRNFLVSDWSSPLSILGGVSRFLFMPLIFNDNGTTFLNLASIEGPLWWIVYFYALISICNGLISRRDIPPVALLSIIFVAGFLLMSAFIETNLGTSFRHRSMILIPLLITYLAKPMQKAGE